MERNNTNDPTPYAVICPVHGLQFLKHEEYSNQLSKADDQWRCPKCGGIASWDDYCQVMDSPD